MTEPVPKDLSARVLGGQEITAEEMAVIVSNLRGERAKAIDLTAIKKASTRKAKEPKGAKASGLLADFEAQMKERAE